VPDQIRIWPVPGQILLAFYFEDNDLVAQDIFSSIARTMEVKRTALKSKSSFAFVWYLLAWFSFRTLPTLYFKGVHHSGAVEQKKWETKVRML
jgi:hypothetical protein